MLRRVNLISIGAVALVLAGCASNVYRGKYREEYPVKAANAVKDGNRALDELRLVDAHRLYLESLKWSLTPQAYDGLGRVFFRGGDIKNAEIYLQKAISLNSDYAPSYRNLALLYEYQGEYHKAESFYRTAVLVDPANAVSHSNFADFLKKYERGSSNESSYHSWMARQLSKYLISSEE